MYILDWLVSHVVTQANTLLVDYIVIYRCIQGLSKYCKQWHPLCMRGAAMHDYMRVIVASELSYRP